MRKAGAASRRKGKTGLSEQATGFQVVMSRGKNFRGSGIQARTAAIERTVSAIERQARGELSTGIQFETLEHEGEDILPGFEDDITQQGFQILKKGLASAQSLANGAVLLIDQV